MFQCWFAPVICLDGTAVSCLLLVKHYDQRCRLPYQKPSGHPAVLSSCSLFATSRLFLSSRTTWASPDFDTNQNSIYMGLKIRSSIFMLDWYNICTVERQKRRKRKRGRERQLTCWCADYGTCTPEIFNRLFKIDNREQKKLFLAHRRSRRKKPYSADWLTWKKIWIYFWLCQTRRRWPELIMAAAFKKVYSVHRSFNLSMFC